MTNEELRLSLERHIKRIETIIEKRKNQNDQLSKIRLGFFIGSLLILYIVFGLISDGVYLSMLGMLIISFLFLVDRHRRVNHSLEKFEHLRDIKHEHIARIELNWKRISYNDIEIDVKNHPFANDLDILGPHSLFHLINTSIYTESAQKLVEWFLSTSPIKEDVRKRQQQVKELSVLSGFRDKLRVVGLFSKSHTSGKDWSNKQMLNWLRMPTITGFKLPLIILSVLSVVNLILVVLTTIELVNPLFLMVSLIVYLVVYKLNDQKFMGMFDATYQIEKILNRFKAILFQIEGFTPRIGSELDELLKAYHDEEVRPSRLIKKAQNLMSRAALQANQLVWMIVNFAIPWDLYHAMKVEQLKEELEPKLTVWLDVFYEFEALNSLANFAMLNPDFVNSNFELDNNTLFEATNLGHPLLSSSQRITNDFKVEKGRDLFLITGSNMAGKSTFLRTVGINLILAYSGAPVCATSFNTSFFRVFSSINITDSLDDGLSHFYTEVKRLKFLLDELMKDDEQPLFFFVDEIYRGTNNRERYTGSAAFLKEVAGKNGVGLVSSHDLELADLDKEIPQLSNWHFVESIEDGKMSFEYRLKSGPCPSTNALQIMKSEGLPT